MVVKMMHMMNVFLLFLPPQGAGWNSAETSSFGARRRVCECDYVTYSARTHKFSVVLCTDARLHAPHRFVHVQNVCVATHTRTHLSPFKFLCPRSCAFKLNLPPASRARCKHVSCRLWAQWMILWSQFIRETPEAVSALQIQHDK